MAFTLSQAEGFRRQYIKHLGRSIRVMNQQLTALHQHRVRKHQMKKLVTSIVTSTAPFYIMSIDWQKHEDPRLTGIWLLYWNATSKVSRQVLSLDALCINRYGMFPASHNLYVTGHAIDRCMQYVFRMTESDLTLGHMKGAMQYMTACVHSPNRPIREGANFVMNKDDEVSALLYADDYGEDSHLIKTFLPWPSFEQHTLDMIRRTKMVPQTEEH